MTSSSYGGVMVRISVDTLGGAQEDQQSRPLAVEVIEPAANGRGVQLAHQCDGVSQGWVCRVHDPRVGVARHDM
jgi:hypothetical protein